MTFDHLPSLLARIGDAPRWTLSVMVLACTLVVALLLYEAGVRLVRRVLSERSAFTRSLVLRTRGPGRLALLVAATSWAIRLSPLRGSLEAWVQHLLLIAGIVLAGWCVMTAIEIAFALHMRNYRIDVADNLLARKHLTQARILKQALAVLVIVLTAGIALMTIPTVRQVGVSLLAAGGAAGVIVGLSLQPILSNLLAGVQIALTQPIRLEDAVIVENEFGNVEEINGAYVVVRLWDLRRMVLPLKYFLEKPFQNWTRESARLLGSAMIYVDYRTPIEPLRAKLKQIVEASPLWDGQTVALQVTDAREHTIELRCLAGALNSGQLFELRCEIREKMIAYVQAEFPEALPRRRLEFSPAEPAWAASRDAADRVQ
ncbi:MAG: mechanosensitive ion channel family protein [Proteobacteria bacterium]|nr:mechanosensitive ion channel family protein [Pseudomonadota bacterium]